MIISIIRSMTKAMMESMTTSISAQLHKSSLISHAIGFVQFSLAK